MCGIYGSVGFTPDRSRIDIVEHRGPDGSGWELFESPAGPVALGHRRLAIIDLSDAGLQPMSDASSRYHLTFNGEIYNYIELREQLRAEGRVVTSDSDSEVLLQSYIAWGDACLERFRGMFAFIIWDASEKVLFAARDRFGIKPLYYAKTEHGLALGSEIKQFHGLPGLATRMNVARVHDFLASGISNHTGETMFEGIHQLRGGEALRVECGGRPLELEIRRWYPVRAQAIDISEADAGERFHALLTDAVRLHLRADVPVGSCLSGGLDSSSLVCLMTPMLARDGGSAVIAISACYAEKSVDEKPFMEAVVAKTGATPHYIYPKPEELLEIASDLTWHQDEPFGSTSIFAQWRVFEEAKRNGITVMIDGQGADEQLAGYHASFPYYINALLQGGHYGTLARTVLERNRYHGLPIMQQISALAPRVLPAKLAALVPKPAIKSHPQHDWLGGSAIKERGNPKGAVAVAEELLGLPAVHDIASLCMTLTYASNLAMLLHFEDRNSMAHSIEARVPFLDHPLVEFSLGLGNDHKIVGGDTKRVLRRAMAGVLPDAVLNRRDKLGFSTPEQIWLQGPMRPAMEAGVEKTLALYPELFDVEATRAYTREILDGTRPFETTLWRIVNLGIWGERFNVTL